MFVETELTLGTALGREKREKGLLPIGAQIDYRICYLTYLHYLTSIPTLPTYLTYLMYLLTLPNYHTYLHYLPNLPYVLTYFTYLPYVPYLLSLPTYLTYLMYLPTYLPTYFTYLPVYLYLKTRYTFKSIHRLRGRTSKRASVRPTVIRTWRVSFAFFALTPQPLKPESSLISRRS